MLERTLGRKDSEPQCRDPGVGARFSPEISKREMQPLLAPQLLAPSGSELRAG